MVLNIGCTLADTFHGGCEHLSSPSTYHAWPMEGNVVATRDLSLPHYKRRLSTAFWEAFGKTFEGDEDKDYESKCSEVFREGQAVKAITSFKKDGLARLHGGEGKHWCKGQVTEVHEKEFKTTAKCEKDTEDTISTYSCADTSADKDKIKDEVCPTGDEFFNHKCRCASSIKKPSSGCSGFAGGGADSLAAATNVLSLQQPPRPCMPLTKFRGPCRDKSLHSFL